jgi:hypothetical protein
MRHIFRLMIGILLATMVFVQPKPTRADAFLDVLNVTCAGASFRVNAPSTGFSDLIFFIRFTFPTMMPYYSTFYPLGTHYLDFTFLVGGPVPPPTFIEIGYYDGPNLTIVFAQDCDGPKFFSPCGTVLPIYGAAVMAAEDKRPGLTEAAGSQAINRDGAPIFLPHDADGNGFDEMLILDIDEGYFGLDVGGCDPLYVLQTAVRVTRLTDLGRLAFGE